VFGLGVVGVINVLILSIDVLLVGWMAVYVVFAGWVGLFVGVYVSGP